MRRLARMTAVGAAAVVATLVAAGPAAGGGPLRLVDAPVGWVRAAPAPAPTGALLCGFQPPGRPVALARSRFEDPAGLPEVRSSWVAFRGVRGAQRFVAAFREAVRTCPSYTVAGPDGQPVEVQVTAAAFPTLGDASFGYLRRLTIQSTALGFYTIVARRARWVAQVTLVSRDVPDAALALLLARRAVRRV